MGFRIQNNIASINAHNYLTKSDNAMSKTLGRLSSGYRINSASDDAAGLSASMRLRAETASLKVASRNAAEASSALQVAEGAMSEVGSILERLKELATQAASGNSNADLAKIDAERADLTTEIDRIVNFTQYGGATLLNGSYGGVKLDTNTANTTAYLIGVRNIDVTNAKANETYTIDVRDADGDTGVDDITLTETSTGNSQSIMNVAGTVSGLAMNATADLDFSMLGVKITVDNRLVVSNGNGIDNGATNDIATLATAPSAKFQIGNKNNSDNQISFSLSTLATATLFGGAMSFSSMSGAQTALGTLDTAISTLATERGKVGGLLNRFAYAQSNLATSIENKTASESVIRDVDMAAEMSNFTKYQILVQAGTAMLAQANQAPQNVLSLLR